MTKGKEVAGVESVKAASDVISPVTGEVLETNPAIVSDPALVNSDPMGAGWFFKVRIEQSSELMERWTPRNIGSSRNRDKFSPMWPPGWAPGDGHCSAK